LSSAAAFSAAASLTFGGGDRVAQRDRVDLEQARLAGLDPVAVVYPDGVQIAADARRHVRIVFGLQRALDHEAPLEVARGGQHDLDRQRRLSGRCGGVRGVRFAASASGGQQQERETRAPPHPSSRRLRTAMNNRVLSHHIHPSPCGLSVES